MFGYLYPLNIGECTYVMDIYWGFVFECILVTFQIFYIPKKLLLHF